MVFQLQILIAAPYQLLSVPVWNLSRDLLRKVVPISATFLCYGCILGCDLLCWSLSNNVVQSASYVPRLHQPFWSVNVIPLAPPFFWFVSSAAKDLFIFICVLPFQWEFRIQRRHCWSCPSSWTKKLYSYLRSYIAILEAIQLSKCLYLNLANTHLTIHKQADLTVSR